MKSLSMKAGNTDTVEHCCWTNKSGEDEWMMSYADMLSRSSHCLNRSSTTASAAECSNRQACLPLSEYMLMDWM